MTDKELDEIEFWAETQLSDPRSTDVKCVIAELRRERVKVKVGREALDAIRGDYVGYGHLAGSALKEMDALDKIREDG